MRCPVSKLYRGENVENSTQTDLLVDTRMFELWDAKDCLFGSEEGCRGIGSNVRVWRPCVPIVFLTDLQHSS